MTSGIVCVILWFVYHNTQRIAVVEERLALFGATTKELNASAQFVASGANDLRQVIEDLRDLSQVARQQEALQLAIEDQGRDIEFIASELGYLRKQIETGATIRSPDDP